MFLLEERRSGSCYVLYCIYLGLAASKPEDVCLFVTSSLTCFAFISCLLHDLVTSPPLQDSSQVTCHEQKSRDLRAASPLPRARPRPDWTGPVAGSRYPRFHRQPKTSKALGDGGDTRALGEGVGIMESLIVIDAHGSCCCVALKIEYIHAR